MSVLMDLWHSIVGIVTSSSPITLVIMAVVIIAAAFMTEGFGSLVSATVGALVIFGIATTVYAAVTAKAGANWAGMPQSDWAALQHLTVDHLVAYAILFAVAIGLVGFVRSLFMR